MENSRAKYLLPCVGIVLIASAVMELLSLQNELFRIIFYWTYVACVPGIALLLLSMAPVKIPAWRYLFVPAALLCFLMPFMCWHERTLTENLHLYFCRQLLLPVVFWLLFALLGVLREFYTRKRLVFWLRVFVLYLMLVPCCALIAANFCDIFAKSGQGVFSESFMILWSRANVGSVMLNLFASTATLIVAAFCLAPHDMNVVQPPIVEASTEPESSVLADAIGDETNPADDGNGEETKEN